jgi:drug/metabolite transporter (DMT)-like permease
MANVTSATGTAEPQGQADRLQGVDILYAALFCLLWSGTSASAASSLLFITPPLGLFIGWLVLDEPVAFADFIGIIPIAIGIRLATSG